MWFLPNSALSDKQIAELPTGVATRLPSCLDALAVALSQDENREPISIDAFSRFSGSEAAANRLDTLFRKYGSDKSTVHDYHKIYGHLLTIMSGKTKILEIGLGSNDISYPSNMGALGSPGASVRAFKEFSPDVDVYGADIDPSIRIDGIRTFVVDQLQPDSFDSITHNLGFDFDLIIDDGLHSPDANLNTLIFGLKHISSRGYIVIEDIPERALPIWYVVLKLIKPTRFRASLYKCLCAYAFILTLNSNLP